MPRKPAKYWEKHVSDWRMSGYSASQYSLIHKLSPATLLRWGKKINDKPKAIKIDLPKTAKDSNFIILTQKSITIKIPSTISPDLLSVILREIR